MNDIINRCDAVINKLLKFSNDIISLGTSIQDDRIKLFQQKIGFNLPLDFKYIVEKFNGISLMGVQIFGLDDHLRGSSIDTVYNFEHFEVSNKMPKQLLPFSPDGRGNHYCLDLSEMSNGVCPVIFWQWDYNYRDKEEIEICNSNFIDWINEVMIEWVLDEYNYDGSEK